MRRRKFLGLIGASAAAWPLAVWAQEEERTKRVGVLMGLSQADPESRAFLAAFSEELARLSSANHFSLQIEPRWTNADPGRTRALAAEIVRTKPDVIFAAATPAVAALREQTASIPIVFTYVSDPIGAKFAASLSHPGGNITGFSHTDAKLGGKWLDFLKEAAPDIKRAAIMFNPDTAPSRGAVFISSFEAAAGLLGVKPLSAPVHDVADIQTAIAALDAQFCGLVLMDDAFMGVNFRAAIAAAGRANIPTVAPFPTYAADGGLMTYHANIPQLFRQAAGYVDRILRGEKPSDLPVQTPTKYQLVINLRTARALGLEIPPTLLGVADEVIE